MSCNDWKEVKLEEVCRFQNGYAFKSSEFDCNGDSKIIKIKELKDGKIQLFNDTSKVIFDKKHSKYLIYNNDILFALTGDPVSKTNPLSWVGRVSKNYYNERLLLNQRVCKAIPNTNKVYNDFIYYFFRQYDELFRLASKASGSASQANISTKTLESTSLSLPPLPEQKAIADTLSCLDDKIELNNKINKNLEAQAQAIFKSWFVDFEPFQDGEFVDSELGRIPKGWRVGTLGEVADIQMGQSPKGTSYNENKVGTVFYQGRTDFGIRYPKIRLYTTEPKRIASESDILLSVRAPVGDINIASEKCCIGRGLASLKSNIQCNSFVFYSLLNLKENFAVYNSEGTVFGSINKDTLNNIKVIMPKENVIFDFHKIAGTIDECILINAKQAQTLTAMRDTLLPKLMSGEIRIPPSQSIRD